MSRNYEFMYIGHSKYHDVIKNGLGTQNTNLHIMTSAYSWKIDGISVNIYLIWTGLEGDITYISQT